MKLRSHSLAITTVFLLGTAANKTFQDPDVLKASVQPLTAALDEINAELYGGKK
jgi:hypothetical protein